MHADVDGDGRADTVVLYATLTNQKHGSQFEPKAFWLVVHLANGHELRARLPRPESNAFFLQHGNINHVAGDEMIIQVTRISSASEAAIYTDDGGQLYREPVLFGFGGDSITKSSFSCGLQPKPYSDVIAQHSYELLGTNTTSPWRETNINYAWRRSRLHEYLHRTTTIQHLPAGETTLQRSCGRFDVASSSVR